jgi:hypothetical protein
VLASDELEGLEAGDIEAVLAGARRVQGDARSIGRDLAAVTEGLLYSRLDQRAGALLDALDTALASLTDKSFEPEPWRELARRQAAGELGTAELAAQLVTMVGLGLEVSEEHAAAATTSLERARETDGPAALREALAEAEVHQRTAKDRLEELLGKLAEWDNFQSVLSNLRDIVNGQKTSWSGLASSRRNIDMNRIASLVVFALLASPAARALPARQNTGEGSREQATLLDEQARLARKLVRLQEQMNALADRFQAEGRVHAAKLLRDGVEELAVRDEKSESMTLPEIMEASRGDIQDGRAVTAVDRQQAAIARLERLLDILLDRQAIEDLEKSLQELSAIKEALGQLADREHALRDDTEALRTDSANDAQRSLEKQLAELRARQRELLEKNEAAGRESGELELEAIQKELDELIAQERADASVLGSWRPAERTELEELRHALESSRDALAREERYQSASDELNQASDAASRASTPEERAALAKKLADAAEREDRHARASGNAAAKETAEALQKSAEEVAAADSDAAREKAAAAARERAEALARSAQSARGEAQQASSAARAKASEMAEQPSTAGMVAEDVAKTLEPEGAESASEEPREAVEKARHSCARK